LKLSENLWIWLLLYSNVEKDTFLFYFLKKHLTMFINRYEKHLFILTNKVEDFDKVRASDYICGVSTQLNNIPKIINIDGYDYKLRGAIELKTSKNDIFR
jgi:hypothetical protein